MQPEKGPNPRYDFIMKDAKAPKRSLLPSGNPAMLLAAGVVLILLIILVAGILLGGKGNKGTTGLVDALGKAQEINRVTTAQQPNLKDPNTTALAATAQATVASEQTQINKYLTGRKVKIDKKKLATYQNKTTDSQLAAALQTNSLDAAYSAYLKGALADYAQSLKDAYSATTNTSAKAILQNAYASTQTLLSSPPLK
jgi:hypothetical protein